MCGKEDFLEAKDIARYFVYLEKMSKLSSAKEINFKNIQAKKFYTDNKKIFDKFFYLSEKYKIDKARYVRFFIKNLNKGKKEIKTDFLCINTLNKYVEHLQIQVQYAKIYDNVFKSINNIVNDCIEFGYSDARNYLKDLISENRLAEKVISGKISQYYLVTIKNIDKIIDGMDSISKDELKNISKRKDKLRADTQNAFLNIKSQQMSPIKLTNEILNKKLTTKNNNNY